MRLTGLLFILITILFSGCNGSPTGKSNAGSSDEKPVMKTATSEADGEKLYQVHCAVCHSADGTGKENLYPPLIASEYLTGDKSRLIGIVLHGMTGEITVAGKTYNNVMAPLNYLKDEQIAAILTWVKKEFGGGSDAVGADEVKNER